MILDLFIYIIQFYINQNTFLPGFIIRKEELSDEFSSSHVADSSSTFAHLDYIMNFSKVNVRDLAKAKYEDTYLLTTFKLYHVF